jgi:hypothetical protein
MENILDPRMKALIERAQKMREKRSEMSKEEMREKIRNSKFFQRLRELKAAQDAKVESNE